MLHLFAYVAGGRRGKLFEIAERSGCEMDLESRQSIEHGIEIGRGGMWLSLTPEQFAKLAKP